MLQNEVAVQQHGLHFGEEVVIAIEVAPARLHHAHLRIGEEVHGAHQEVGGRAEIGVEDGHQLAGGGLQAFLQRAGLEAMPVGAVMVLDGIAQGPVALHQRFGERRGIVGGIVQHLDLQQLLGVLDLQHLFDQPLHHVPLVVERKLNGDRRKLREAHRRLASGLLAVLEIGADHLVAVQAVHREDRQDGEIRDQHRPVEPGQLMDAGERSLGKHLREALGGRAGGQKSE